MFVLTCRLKKIQEKKKQRRAREELEKKERLKQLGQGKSLLSCLHSTLLCTTLMCMYRGYGRKVDI